MTDAEIKAMYQEAAGQPDAVDISNAASKNNDENMKDLFQEGHDAPSLEETQAQEQAAAPKGMIGQGVDFVKNLPESAIDLVPGMKDRRQSIAAQRATPQYQNAPSDVPNMPQGQRDASFQQAGQDAMNDPAMAFAQATGPTSWKDLLAGISARGSKILGVGAPKLASTASKLAEESMGMNSAKGVIPKWNEATQSMDRGSDVVKGIGTTAMDQGVLGKGNSFDNALGALKTNSSKLSPLLDSVQTKIDPNLPNLLDQVGSLTTKTPKVVQDLVNEVSDTGQQQRLMKVLTNQYQVWEPQLSAADGNLQQLNTLKQQLTSKAEEVFPSVYNPNAPAPTSAMKMEGELYQRLAGVVRQHIEDLANAADAGAGTQIKQLNQNIGHLTEMLPQLNANQRVKFPSTWKEVGQKIAGPVESYAAKGLNYASKVVDTPMGPIDQQVTRDATTSPWQATKDLYSAGKNVVFGSEPDSTYVTRILSNATPESLKDVADRFQQNPATQSCGEMLNKAVAENDTGMKNRAIFCAAQTKQARALLGSGGNK